MRAQPAQQDAAVRVAGHVLEVDRHVIRRDAGRPRAPATRRSRARAPITISSQPMFVSSSTVARADTGRGDRPAIAAPRTVHERERRARDRLGRRRSRADRLRERRLARAELAGERDDERRRARRGRTPRPTRRARRSSWRPVARARASGGTMVDGVHVHRQRARANVRRTRRASARAFPSAFAL